jgi:hypothetical protein
MPKHQLPYDVDLSTIGPMIFEWLMTPAVDASMTSRNSLGR